MTKTLEKKQSYIPGMCNINKAEIAKRRRTMQVGIAVTIVLLMVLVFFQVNIFFRSVVLFVPLYITVISYLQVQNKFCAFYGMTGQQNAVEGHKKAEKVAREAALVDKDRARKMAYQALAATVIIVLILLLVPSV
ncbi:MAG TPA: hypothetical protein VGE34_02920 [Candidatus Saccharimonadales bacterium]